MDTEALEHNLDRDDYPAQWVRVPTHEVLPDGSRGAEVDVAVYDVTTDAGIAAAAQALREAGIDSAPVRAGSPPDTVVTSTVVFAAD